MIKNTLLVLIFLSVFLLKGQDTRVVVDTVNYTYSDDDSKNEIRNKAIRVLLKQVSDKYVGVIIQAETNLRTIECNEKFEQTFCEVIKEKSTMAAKILNIIDERGGRDWEMNNYRLVARVEIDLAMIKKIINKEKELFEEQKQKEKLQAELDIERQRRQRENRKNEELRQRLREKERELERKERERQRELEEKEREKQIALQQRDRQKEREMIEELKNMRDEIANREADKRQKELEEERELQLKRQRLANERQYLETNFTPIQIIKYTFDKISLKLGYTHSINNKLKISDEKYVDFGPLASLGLQYNRPIYTIFGLSIRCDVNMNIGNNNVIDYRYTINDKPGTIIKASFLAYFGYQFKLTFGPVVSFTNWYHASKEQIGFSLGMNTDDFLFYFFEALSGHGFSFSFDVELVDINRIDNIEESLVYYLGLSYNIAMFID